MWERECVGVSKWERVSVGEGGGERVWERD